MCFKIYSLSDMRGNLVWSCFNPPFFCHYNNALILFGRFIDYCILSIKNMPLNFILYYSKYLCFGELEPMRHWLYWDGERWAVRIRVTTEAWILDFKILQTITTISFQMLVFEFLWFLLRSFWVLLGSFWVLSMLPACTLY